MSETILYWTILASQLLLGVAMVAATTRMIRGPRAQRFYEAARRGLDTPESQWPKVVRTPRQRPSKAPIASRSALRPSQ